MWKNVFKGVGDGGLNLGPDREITRDQWLKEVFPEWKTILNKEIEETKPKENTFILWWLGGASWWMKSAGGANLCIDQYSGSGGGMEYNDVSRYSGVVRMTGAQQMYWIRCVPHVLDPWAIKECDAYLQLIYTLTIVISSRSNHYYRIPIANLSALQNAVTFSRDGKSQTIELKLLNQVM